MCFMNCPYEGLSGTCRHPSRNSLDPEAGCYEGDDEELDEEEEEQEDDIPRS